MLPSLLSGGAPNKFDVQPSVEGSGDAGESREARRLAVARLHYRQRDAEHTVLHQVIAEHLEAFLSAVAESGDGAGLPAVR